MAYLRNIEIVIGQTTIIKDLRIGFGFKKSNVPTKNNATIQIFNPSPETIKAAQKAKQEFIIKAGYEDEPAGSLFFGDLVRASVTRSGVDRILEVELADGQTAADSAIVSISMAAGTTTLAIVSKLADALKLGTRNIQEVPMTEYPTGWAFEGKAVSALKTVLAKDGWTYSIQNRQLVFFEKGKPASTTPLLLSRSTGLLGTPEPLFDPEQPTKTAGWRIQSIVHPDLVPSATFQIRSEAVTGTMVIQNVEAAGDNWDGDFGYTMEVASL